MRFLRANRQAGNSRPESYGYSATDRATVTPRGDSAAQAQTCWQPTRAHPAAAGANERRRSARSPARPTRGNSVAGWARCAAMPLERRPLRAAQVPARRREVARTARVERSRPFCLAALVHGAPRPARERPTSVAGQEGTPGVARQGILAGLGAVYANHRAGQSPSIFVRKEQEQPQPAIRRQSRL